MFQLSRVVGGGKSLPHNPGGKYGGHHIQDGRGNPDLKSGNMQAVE